MTQQPDTLRRDERQSGKRDKAMGREPTKQAKGDSRTGYGMNAQGAEEAMRMSPHDVILYCKD